MTDRGRGRPPGPPPGRGGRPGDAGGGGGDGGAGDWESRSWSPTRRTWCGRGTGRGTADQREDRGGDGGVARLPRLGCSPDDGKQGPPPLTRAPTAPPCGSGGASRGCGTGGLTGTARRGFAAGDAGIGPHHRPCRGRGYPGYGVLAVLHRKELLLRIYGLVGRRAMGRTRKDHHGFAGNPVTDNGWLGCDQFTQAGSGNRTAAIREYQRPLEFDPRAAGFAGSSRPQGRHPRLAMLEKTKAWMAGLRPP